MLRVEEDRDEDFVLPAAQRQPQVVAHRLGRGQRAPGAHLLAERPARHFEDRSQLGQLRAAQPLDCAECGLVRGQEAAQPAETGQQLTRQLHRALAADAGAQEQRDQLRV